LTLFIARLIYASKLLSKGECPCKGVIFMELRPVDFQSLAKVSEQAQNLQLQERAAAERVKEDLVRQQMKEEEDRLKVEDTKESATRKIKDDEKEKKGFSGGEVFTKGEEDENADDNEDFEWAGNSSSIIDILV